MAEPEKRYFTVPEVESLIPRLERAMGRVMELQAEAARVRRALQDAQRQIMLAGGSRLDQEFWRAGKTRLARTGQELQARLGEILHLGGVPKDLTLGLVDFLGLVDRQEVNLCWRLGEKRIRFWHGLDEGYTGRKPIPGSDPEERA